jgi:hypothetical protein
MSEARYEDMLPIPDAFGEGVQQVQHHAEQTMGDEHVLISNGWHFRLVNGNVFITAEQPSTVQAVLNAIAASDLLVFLASHQAELSERRQALLTLMQQPEQREPEQKMDPSV